MNKRNRPRRADSRPLDPIRIWTEIEDFFVPNLGPWLSERALYFHLIRRTRLTGRRALLTSTGELARNMRMSRKSARTALWRLANKGAVRVLERNRSGHLVEVRIPNEIPGCLRASPGSNSSSPISEAWLRSKAGRRAVFERDGNRCFYCLRQLDTRSSVLDHIHPRARGGREDYWNLVACCFSCNSMKRDSTPLDFLRQLVRENLINRREFRQRLAALQALRKGLKPKLPKAA
jgi:hypothetical protein